MERELNLAYLDDVTADVVEGGVVVGDDPLEGREAGVAVLLALLHAVRVIAGASEGQRLRVADECVRYVRRS